MGGAGWRVGGTKTASSSLRIGFTADDLLLEISVRTLKEQDALRRKYELQQGHRAILGTTDQLLVFKEHRASLKLKARAVGGGAAVGDGAAGGDGAAI